MANKSLSDLVDFLDYLGDKGLMAKNTVGGRKAAVGKVLGVLDPEEVQDVFTINIEQAMTRFINLEGKSYTPGSLKVYRSRVAASIGDFKRYLDDPAGFKLEGSKAATKATSAAPASKAKTSKSTTPSPIAPSAPADPSSSSPNVLPIPIRENVTVRVFGLPFDLKPVEANKIANVVKAMAME